MSELGSWLDQSDCAEQIERKRASGAITSEEAEQLGHFAREGYLVLRLETEAVDHLVLEIDRFWRERPHDLACAGPDDRFLRRMDEVDPSRMRGPAGRIHDPQSHSSPARELYLHPRLHRMAELIFGATPVAINSILFEFGSGQELHRDRQYVPVSREGRLAAAWIALEDIDPAAGPLAYIPGSHRLPDSAVDRRGAVTFTPRKGDVLFWHAKLYHGGEPVRDRARTRKSFVIHFSAFD